MVFFFETFIPFGTPNIQFYRKFDQSQAIACTVAVNQKKMLDSLKHDGSIVPALTKEGLVHAGKVVKGLEFALAPVPRRSLMLMYVFHLKRGRLQFQHWLVAVPSIYFKTLSVFFHDVQLFEGRFGAYVKRLWEHIELLSKPFRDMPHQRQKFVSINTPQKRLWILPTLSEFSYSINRQRGMIHQ